MGQLLTVPLYNTQIFLSRLCYINFLICINVLFRFGEFADFL